jgi:3-hydroxybutyrate dehydrogenase
MATLDVHHAVVTGGGRGIGRAIATRLTRQGTTVTVIGRSREALEEAVAEGDAAGLEVGDVTDRAAFERAVESAASARGPISILVNNAGWAESGPFLKADISFFSEMWNVHVLAAVHATQMVLPGMIERGFGRIVNIASTAGLKGYPYVSAYCAAKHGLVGLTRSLASEVAKTGVTVNAVCPGYTETDLVRASVDRIAAKTGRSRDDAIAQITGGSPLGRLIRPAEVAASVVFLCSPDAAAVTGATIAVAGGET